MSTAKHRIELAPLTANERVRQCAARAREMERLAQGADAEVSRLRKEMKRARKAYTRAKEAAKQAAKESQEARTELSACLDEAFCDLAMALQGSGNLASAFDAPDSGASHPQNGVEADVEHPRTGLEEPRPIAASG